MIKQNPFSLYDFLGYLIPGALFLQIIFIIPNNENINSINDLFTVINKSEFIQFDKIFLFTILSYCLGHFISYFSSITIEKYCYWKYDYPSKYLLGIEKEEENYIPSHFAIEIKFIRFFLGIFLIPIIIYDYIIGEKLKLKVYYTKKLDSYLIEIIQSKGTILLKKLSPIVPGKKLREYDFHRIFSHYVYENSKAHQYKLTNYVALYGFLRSTTLISLIIFWSLSIYCMIHFFQYWSQIYHESLTPSLSDFNCVLFFFTLISTISTYIFYMAFMKFYRRYSLEIFMILAVDTSLVEKETK